MTLFKIICLKHVRIGRQNKSKHNQSINQSIKQTNNTSEHPGKTERVFVFKVSYLGFRKLVFQEIKNKPGEEICCV